MPTVFTNLSHLLCLLALLASGSGVAVAKVIPPGPETPPEMVGVGVDEQLGAQLPLDLKFRNKEGEWVTLGSFFTGEKPVLLLMNYSDCPMLCGRQLTDLVTTMNMDGMEEFTVGSEFDIVSVSIDPREQPQRAKQTHKLYSEKYGRPGSARGWHFLVGNEEEITKLADAVGFRYNFVPSTGEYAHAATIMVMTPQGVVSRYINGVGYDPKTLRLSMVEAADGKVGSTMDQILLTCFIYDHTKGRYAPHAFGIMKIGAATTIIIMGLMLAPYWLRQRKQASLNETGTLADEVDQT